MLITLRNSGAEAIQYTPVLEDEFKLKIADGSSHDSSGYDMFLKGQELDSFVVDKEDVTLLHLVVDSRGWGADKTVHYSIHIETDSNRHYRLHYKGGEKPDFFKKVFRYFYPEDADSQIEELV